jgi:GGDEF domain-containing protein
MLARRETVTEPDEGWVDVRHENARLEQRVRTLTERIVQLRGELAQALARVAALTTTDDTTGLLTWRAFAERAHTEIARATRYQREIGLVVFAVAEPTRRRQLAEICRSQHRDCDVAGHTESGEIVLLLPETSVHGALVIAQRIRAQVAKGGGVATAGCAAWPQHGRTLTALVSTARSAMSAR